MRTIHNSFSRIGYWSVPAGFILGILLALAFFAYGESINTWHQLSYPALSSLIDKATELLGYNNDLETVYIKTTSRHIYACRSNLNSQICIPFDQNSQAQLKNDTECAFTIYSTPNPPGIVVSQIESHPCMPDTVMQVNHIILDDGSIWRWTTGTSDLYEGLKGFFTILSGLIGATLGLVVGILLYVYKRKVGNNRLLLAQSMVELCENFDVTLNAIKQQIAQDKS